MRCLCCDVLLDDFEVLRKYPKGHELEGQHVDICTKCLVQIMDTTNFVPDYVTVEDVDSQGILFTDQGTAIEGDE